MINKFIKPNILIPKESIDMTKWSVVACDQFTSQPEYWEELKNYVGDSYSCLDLIFPEVYLSKDNSKKIADINVNMARYINDGIFKEVNDYILVVRDLPNGMKRLGLMLIVDLEDYEYTTINDALIKATERTVIDRLPPRIEVRKNASLELPHIMLLVDDPEKQIIESLYEQVDKLENLYDFELNMKGGHIKGYRISDSQAIATKFAKLIAPETMKAKYNTKKQMLFAVGDGNHSLATAKACWQELKQKLDVNEIKNHPARYALCELVNLHDDSLVFEPIHRVLFNADEKFILAMTKVLDGNARLKIMYRDKKYVLNIPENPSDAIKDIQDFIDEYISEHKEIEQDYIHGDEHLKKVISDKEAVGIYMPTLAKEGLFDYVIRRGVLPRKSFSMGNAEDKRYYLETRKIIK